MVGMLIWQCEVCKTSVPYRELRLTQRQLGPRRRVHVGCLTPLERRAMFIAASGLPCLFCDRRGLTMHELIDHFGQAHGRVLVNW